MKDILGFEGRYSINETGDVFAHPKKVAVGRNGGVRDYGWHKLSATKPMKGLDYTRVYLAKDGKKFPRLTHRLVAETYIPNPDNLPVVNHLDGNPGNNHVSNLEWCTVRANSIHAYAFGLHKPSKLFGEANGQSKITAETVKAMRQCFVETGNTAEVARRFGLKAKHAYDICHGKRWAHII